VTSKDVDSGADICSLFVPILLEGFLDWAMAIERNRVVLVGIVSALLVMMGGSSRLSRDVRSHVLRILRPAEAAVRRLIFVSARGLLLKPAAVRAFPASGIAAAGAGKRPWRLGRGFKFQLADEMPPMVAPREDDALKGPRIRSVLPVDPTVAAQLDFQRALARPRASAHDSVVDAAHLAERLQAVKRALETLPRQALRLLRWKARRERLAARRLVYTSPLRPGRVLGHRGPPRHEVERTLQECQWLAFEVLLNSS
jgi:hypothetical protein